MFCGQVEGAGADAGLPEALAAAVRPQALAEYEKALTAVFNAGAEARPFIIYPGQQNDQAITAHAFANSLC